MRNMIDDNELEQVSGGRYWISTQKKRVCWDNVPGVYNLKNCTVYQAQQAMDELVGKYHTQAEYDQACYNLLSSKCWI